METIPVGKATNLTGQTFSRLTVLSRAPNREGRKVYWNCQCTCGNTCVVRSDQLTREITKSCGCYRKETQIEHGKQLAEKYSSIIGKKNKKDLTGQRFGLLTALEDTGKRQIVGNGTNVIWKCQCDCGQLCEVAAGHLLSGHTQSCGCNKKSHGERVIYNLLKKNNIPFEQEYTFTQERLSTGGFAKFDFYVDNKYFIEYDGEQHFDCSSHGWNDEITFQKTQLRDKEKNQFCSKYNIPLIRIPYTHYKKICLEDLLLETSNFLVQETNNDE